ncbi:MAG TPA: hypothetical protein VN947_34420 [Polyangia bacterium]|nr:hypothetical protein [Polyangia bacterium]
MRNLRIALGNAFLLILIASTAGCGNGDSVTSNEQARRAYLGLDKAVSKSLALGFAGYNAAANANIPAQMAAGDATGALTISGHVDQGNPSQISMGLAADMTMYSDGKIVVDDKNDTIVVTYATDSAAAPSLSLKLNASAGNTLTGSLDGDYTMSGDLQGTVTLSLQINGTFSGTAPDVMRVVGSTTVTGTAVNSSGGTYMVNTTL